MKMCFLAIGVAMLAWLALSAQARALPIMAPAGVGPSGPIEAAASKTSSKAMQKRRSGTDAGPHGVTPYSDLPRSMMKSGRSGAGRKGSQQND